MFARCAVIKNYMGILRVFDLFIVIMILFVFSFQKVFVSILASPISVCGSGSEQQTCTLDMRSQIDALSNSCRISSFMTKGVGKVPNLNYEVCFVYRAFSFHHP
jgi:hypothetical protein